MFQVDHVALWTPRAEKLARTIATAAGQPVLDGFRPAGVTVAWGVRFANGPFLDLHRFDDPSLSGSAPRLLALRGSIDAAERLADEHGWRARATRRDAAERPEAEPPWSVLSFRRDQGLLSGLFVIEYSPGAPTPADYQAPLYANDEPQAHESRLTGLRIRTPDPIGDAAILRAFGAEPAEGDPGAHLSVRLGGIPIQFIVADEGPARVDHIEVARAGDETSVSAADDLFVKFTSR